MTLAATNREKRRIQHDFEVALEVREYGVDREQVPIGVLDCVAQRNLQMPAYRPFAETVATGACGREVFKLDRWGDDGRLVFLTTRETERLLQRTQGFKPRELQEEMIRDEPVADRQGKLARNAKRVIVLEVRRFALANQRHRIDIGDLRSLLATDRVGKPRFDRVRYREHTLVNLTCRWLLTARPCECNAEQKDGRAWFS